MAIAVLMPRQGQSVETCILGQWYKTVGEEVNVGDILFSYETDKASFEEEAKTDGVLLATFYNEGDEVPVLVNVAVIGQKGEVVSMSLPPVQRRFWLFAKQAHPTIHQKLSNLKLKPTYSTITSVFRLWQKTWPKNWVLTLIR